ncbi:MAG: aspartate 1-decarboxylase [Planctomycetes bacterium]|nr:aspartate 1-decarboxylase [Planctomycetota bacterium]HPF14529.1 aspartate 1-decarboxylase [Planctomycetota bacterium]HRV82260.1 aspartate 1-decarboxylase [Planctomycetota bacterium]
MRQFLRAKIHKAVVTQANVEYIGSITIDSDLLDRVDIQEYERVLVVDNTNGARLETYALRGEAGSGVVCMNGAAAHKVQPGDEVIIMAFEYADQAVEPKQILVDTHNRYLYDIDPSHRQVPLANKPRERWMPQGS